MKVREMMAALSSYNPELEVAVELCGGHYPPGSLAELDPAPRAWTVINEGRVLSIEEL